MPGKNARLEFDEQYFVPRIGTATTCRFAPAMPSSRGQRPIYFDSGPDTNPVLVIDGGSRRNEGLLSESTGLSSGQSPRDGFSPTLDPSTRSDGGLSTKSRSIF